MRGARSRWRFRGGVAVLVVAGRLFLGGGDHHGSGRHSRSVMTRHTGSVRTRGGARSGGGDVGDTELEAEGETRSGGGAAVIMWRLSGS